MNILKNSKWRAEALEDPKVCYNAQEPMKHVELENMLRSMRTEAKLSQADVAKILGVTPPAVNRLEKRPSHASINTLRRYAKACGFDLYFYYK